jgi:hypothetical protein
MGDNVRWGSPRWKIRSFNVRRKEMLAKISKFVAASAMFD